jgi:rhodanese-related sulfurtransferase
MALPGETSGAAALEPRRIGVAEGRALVEAGRAVLADVRDERLYDNAHIRGASSLPLAVIEASPDRLPEERVPPGDALLLLYCA